MDFLARIQRALEEKYEAQAKRGEQPYAAFCSSTYVFIGQVWRIVLHQHTVGG